LKRSYLETLLEHDFHPTNLCLSNLTRIATISLTMSDCPQLSDEQLVAALRTLGAPIAGEDFHGLFDFKDVMLRGISLAGRDPTLARALPVAIWRNWARVVELNLGTYHDKDRLGLFVELAAQLSDDRDPVAANALLRFAARLHTKSSVGVAPFFANAPHRYRDFDLATRWGFQMNMTLETFQQLFDKFAD
jgi:hypothetical protein